MMKKKLFISLALCLVFALCLTFAACNGDKTQNKLESGDVTAEGNFAEGAVLAASKLDPADSNYTAAIAKIADKDYDKEKVSVFDISLMKDSAKVQPDGKVKITMPAPFETENGYVTYHISGETVEELATTLADGKITFETGSFSFFVVAGTTGGSVIAPGGGGLTPNDPSKNFFAYADGFEQGTLTANGAAVPKGGYAATLREGDTVELIATAGNGYQLLGWFKNAKQSGSDEKYDERNNPATFTYSGTEKVYIYARFDVITYKITVDLAGGEYQTGETIPATYNVETDTITLPTPQRSTMEFLGWVDAAGNPVTEIAKGSTGDITLTAQWQSRTTKVSTIKNRSYGIYNNITNKDEEKVLEGKDMVIGIEDIPFGAGRVRGFPLFKKVDADFQDMIYAMGNLGGFNYEAIVELVVAEGDRNVTVGRIHTVYMGARVKINGLLGEWSIMHIEYEGEMEETDCRFHSAWFDLLPNVEGYTDAKGNWIYQGGPLEVYTDARRVPRVGAVASDRMTLDAYNGYERTGKYDTFEFECLMWNGEYKFDKYMTPYYIAKSKTEDRKYDMIVSGDVEVYIANKETCRMEKLVTSSGKEKKLVTIFSSKDTTESWDTQLLIIVKPGGKVILYNGISPETAMQSAEAGAISCNAATIAYPCQSKKERFLYE